VIGDAFKDREPDASAICIGLHIHCDETARALRVDHRQYVLTLLHLYGMVDGHAVRLPMGVAVKLQKAGTPPTAELERCTRSSWASSFTCARGPFRMLLTRLGG